jgi:hypothetical protein
MIAHCAATGCDSRRIRASMPKPAVDVDHVKLQPTTIGTIIIGARNKVV